MPKRHRSRSRTMKGGFLDDFSNTLSGWGSSLSQGASSMWQKTKSTLTGSPSSSYTPTSSSYTPSSTSSPSSYNPSYQPQMNTSTYGGKYSRRRRHKRGGGLAHNASPVSGIQTAKPHNWVGGRTRRRTRKGCKSHKRKH